MAAFPIIYVENIFSFMYHVYCPCNLQLFIIDRPFCSKRFKFMILQKLHKLHIFKFKTDSFFYVNILPLIFERKFLLIWKSIIIVLYLLVHECAYITRASTFRIPFFKYLSLCNMTLICFIF